MSERAVELALRKSCSEHSPIIRALRLIWPVFVSLVGCSATDATEAPLRESAPAWSSERAPRLLPSSVALSEQAPVWDVSVNDEPHWLAALLSASDHIVRGRVRGVQAHARGPSGEAGIFTRVELDVEDAAEEEHARVLDFWLEGGTLDRRARWLSSGARFRLGEEVVVFLQERDGHRRLVHLGLGKWSASSSPERFAPSARALTHAASGSVVRPAFLSWEEIVSAGAARKLRH